VDSQTVETNDTPSPSRRQLLATLFAGSAAVVAASLVSSQASAAETSPTPVNRDAADNDALNAAITREYRMVATYKTSGITALGDDDKAALMLIHDHHLAYVQALKGYLGPKAVDPSTTALATPTGSFENIASALAVLEDQTATMHIDMLGRLKGKEAATLVASIITVVARHSAALSIVSGVAPTTYLSK